MEIEPGDDLIRRLTRLGPESPRLAKAAGIYRAILPLLREADLSPSPAVLCADDARDRLERGVPLLRGTPPVFNLSAARELMILLAQRLEEQAVAGAGPVREAFEKDQVDLPKLFSCIFSGDDASADSLARGLGLDPLLLATLARNALRPVFRACCRRLAPLVENGFRWERGNCFVCGAPATLGELQGNEQSKRLRCGLCGAGWPYPRIRCARCGNEDHSTLGILYPDPGPDKVRVEVCERCRGYLKVIVTFAPTPPEMLPVEDLATLALDGIAQQRGYRRIPVLVPSAISSETNG